MHVKAAALPMALLGLSACSVGMYNDTVPDSQRVISKLDERVMDVAPFTKANIRISSRLTVRQGSPLKLVISTEDDHWQYLDIRSEDGTLRIDHEGEHTGGRHTMIDLTIPNIEMLHTEGALEASITDLDVQDFDFSHEGMGDVYISGKCTNASYRFEGMGDLEAYDMICDHVSVSFDGMGDAQVFAAQTIRAVGNGFGDIDVRGEPRIEGVESNGFVDIDFHGVPEDDKNKNKNKND